MTLIIGSPILLNVGDCQHDAFHTTTLTHPRPRIHTGHTQEIDREVLEVAARMTRRDRQT